jgi:hypothetical protein
MGSTEHARATYVSWLNAKSSHVPYRTLGRFLSLVIVTGIFELIQSHLPSGVLWRLLVAVLTYPVMLVVVSYPLYRLALKKGWKNVREW